MAAVPYQEFTDDVAPTAPYTDEEKESGKSSPPPAYAPPAYSQQQAYADANAVYNQMQGYPNAPPQVPQQPYAVQQPAQPMHYPQQQYQQPYPAMQSVTVVAPGQSTMQVPRVKRLRAQGKHVVFCILSYIAFYMSYSFFYILIPIAAVAFALALASLWKQERGEERTSNILGWISFAISILSFVLYGAFIFLFVERGHMY